MHDYPFDDTTVRLAVVIGVLFSVLFYERIQLTTGGAIVPGYLSLFLPYPWFIAMTLINAYFTYWLVNKVIAKRFILYGRRKFETEILTTLAFVSLCTGVAHFVTPISPHFAALAGIGFVISAVIAHDMFRQTPCKTTIAVLANTVVVGLFVYIFYTVLKQAPWYSDAVAPGLAEAGLGYPIDLLLFGVIVSVFMGMLLFRHLGLRSGGLVTGAYLALVLVRPADLIFAAVTSIIAYLFTTKFLMNFILIFGRRKMGMMVLVGAIVAWIGEVVVEYATGGAYVPWRGFHVITLMVPALLANDAQRQGVARTFWGAGIAAVGVFTAMNLVDAGRKLLFG